MNLRIAFIAAVVCGVGVLCWFFLRDRAFEPRPDLAVTPVNGSGTLLDVEALKPKVAAFCADCHGMPSPDSFPRDAWFSEVDRGYRFYRESGRTDLEVPVMSQVVAWYRQQAPVVLEVPGSAATIHDTVQFDRQSLSFAEAGARYPAVSALHWTRIGNGSGHVLRFCDMRSGHVSQVLFGSTGLTSATLARLENPAHIESCDLDADGLDDLIIAELGSFQPADHQHGRIIWLRQSSLAGVYETIPLMEGLGRIADVRSADFDQDGDLDLVVAEFGWLKTGRVLLLTNSSENPRQPTFTLQVIDSRHGAIHVPVADLNGDGRPDFLALISQEFEVIEAFINRGDGRFEKKRVYAAGDPSFGSSGIQLVDLDADGDTDVLYSNGDSLDSHYLKPLHAVHWLENTGNLEFVSHEIARLPGASRAIADDLDGDGDADVVAVSFLPVTLLKEKPAGTYDSLVWYENRGGGQFASHRLESSAHGHLALELGDFDEDGDLDLAVGNHGEADTNEDAEWLSVWWNRRITETKGSAIEQVTPGQ